VVVSELTAYREELEENKNGGQRGFENAENDRKREIWTYEDS